MIDGRIIPAYAGSTVFLSVPGAFPPDHPRIRGEHTGLISDKVIPIGSSPHTRGARALRATDTGPLRIIPAYAGSTHHPIPRVSLIKDHPRIRGEHTGIGSLPYWR